jgi:hypothetical protein
MAGRDPPGELDREDHFSSYKELYMMLYHGQMLFLTIGNDTQ